MAYDTAVIIGYSAIMFTMAYLAMNVDREKHGAIQVLFLFLSLFGAWGLLGAITVILEIQTITTLGPLNVSYFTIQFWATIFVLMYLFIMMIFNLYKYLISWKRKRKDGLEPTSEAGVVF